MYNFRVSCCYIYCILTSMIIYRDTDAPFQCFKKCFNLLFDEALFSHKSLGHYYKAQQAVWLCSALWSNVAAVRKLMDFSLYCFTLANSNTCRKGRTSQLLIYQFTSTDEHLFDIILIIYHLYIMWNWTFEMCHL